MSYLYDRQASEFEKFLGPRHYFLAEDIFMQKEKKKKEVNLFPC